jgi:hypothetical protein
MLDMFETLEVFQLHIFWLNKIDPLNVPDILSTFAVFQLLIFLLNSELLQTYLTYQLHWKYYMNL